ncbi:MAG: hypothetical protein IJ938_04235 [Clostridia bacterium]|nr:hypothetical protein [Clostridia bacterium]MBR2070208.1 hypothetical protein [Clostridia bacterium]MBR2160505.1 hypothetical protein [Clostridia bacterium]MBR2323794.1 hypothetical protein [Clostridia bacterium]MBR2397946.1 hypothetical protein [Clostridia bacterium]
MKNICTGVAIGLIVGMLAVSYSPEVKKFTKKAGEVIVEKVRLLKNN